MISAVLWVFDLELCPTTSVQIFEIFIGFVENRAGKFRIVCDQVIEIDDE